MEGELEQPVSPLELFFDLVFVFAITQVSAFVSHDAGWTRLFEGIAILAALWFAWESYVWLAKPRRPTRAPCASSCCRRWARC